MTSQTESLTKTLRVSMNVIKMEKCMPDERWYPLHIYFELGLGLLLMTTI